MGLRVWPKYNEYLQIQLRRPLTEGKAYSFEMYITPSRYSNCFLKKIGASFYPNRPPYTTRAGREDFPPQVETYRPFGVRDTAEWFRINGVFIANEAFTRETAQQELDAGHADAVSFGKTFIANPDLPRRLLLNAPLNPYDNTTFYGYGMEDFAKGYTDYPSLVAEAG